MAFNGSGVFNRIYSWVTDAANGLNVSSTRMDTDTNDIANGLSNCITKDGQQTLTANIPFGGFKITGLGLGTSNTDSASVQNANVKNMAEGRLTLTSATPVTTSDVTAATTLYFSPYKGNCIALYDGTNWSRRTFSELSITNAGLVASKPYDVFVYDNSGTATIELLVWTNDSTRATPLTLQDGVLVKLGALTRRYVGTIRTDSSSKFNDSFALRHVWNYYNRTLRSMRVIEGTNSWNYTTASFRQANGSTSNQLDFVIGWAEDPVNAHVHAFAQNTGANVDVIVAIGVDSTTTMASGCINYSGATQVAAQKIGVDAWLKTYPIVGRHFIAWLELSVAAGTTTWYGNGGSPTSSQSGIEGELWG